ncbi:non-heme iron oxygenase ferredoxin subunit [Actinotalea sp. M2MS4P-6]|uniref:Rieske (2Fe-2S) protein n=1 Tax=Actinotalea sp. M2MS4P-6 TaxID=2983762 RepID=UPI0021E3D01B|nr:non-heme iron oxygenase ferredoxin subunit [Actinotalea sp. M2MS4P-6]MCV2393353.1 non-heme iron oxygenase ferredoxin subunit [Actinotalea sp. M2MS4P-6]
MSSHEACRLADLAPGSALRVEVAGDSGTVEVAVVRADDGSVYAISDICSHGQVSLSDGEVEGHHIECWLHGSMFDLRTGAPQALPATKPVPVYPVTVDGERVLVEVP